MDKFNTQIFSALDNILLPQINVQFDCWLSNLFCHFLDFTDYYYQNNIIFLHRRTQKYPGLAEN